MMPLRMHFPLTRARGIVQYSEVIFTDNLQTAPGFGNGSYSTLKTITLTPKEYLNRPGGGKVRSLLIEFGCQGPASGPLVQVLVNSVRAGPADIAVSTSAQTNCAFSAPCDPSKDAIVEIQGKNTGGGTSDIRNIVITGKI